MIMGKKRLPITISVPHGGTFIPEFVRDKFLLSPREVLLDGDSWTRELYDFKNQVEGYVDTEIARIIVDMNRASNDLPPKNPDGVVKTHSVFGKAIWTNTGLTPREIDHLIEVYHMPYHNRLAKEATNPHVVLGIDCHSMLSFGPVKNRGTWAKRPSFCISNRGDKNGEFAGETLTAPTEMMQKLKTLLELHFRDFVSRPGDIGIEVGADMGEVPLVSINEPFLGGFITRFHGNKGNIPWIQLEINRDLYMPNTIPSSLLPTEVDLLRFEKIRSLLLKVFEELLSNEKGHEPGDKVS